MALGNKTGGRKAGVPNKANAAARERIEHEADPIGFLTSIQLGEEIQTGDARERPTLDQRISASMFLARKLLPDAKDRPVSFPLAATSNPQEVLTTSHAVLAAVAGGSLTPSEGQSIAGLLEVHRKLIETVDLDRRLTAMEGRPK